MNRALVTGGLGFLGGALVERLAAGGVEVLAVDGPAGGRRQQRRGERLASLPRVTVLEAPAAADPVLDALTEVDAVFHLGTFASLKLSWLPASAAPLADDVTTLRRLLGRLRRARCRARLVYASTADVYVPADRPHAAGDPVAARSPLAATALALESLCGQAAGRGVATTVVRVFNAVGPGQRPDLALHRIVESALADVAFPVLTDLATARDYVAVDDVAAALAAATSAELPPGSTLDVGSGTTTTLGGLIALAERHLDRPALVARVPVRQAPRPTSCAALDATVRRLGWEPRVPLDQVVEQQVGWQREERRRGEVARGVQVVRLPGPGVPGPPAPLRPAGGAGG